MTTLGVACPHRLYKEQWSADVGRYLTPSPLSCTLVIWPWSWPSHITFVLHITVNLDWIRTFHIAFAQSQCLADFGHNIHTTFSRYGIWNGPNVCDLHTLVSQRWTWAGPIVLAFKHQSSNFGRLLQPSSVACKHWSTHIRVTWPYCLWPVQFNPSTSHMPTRIVSCLHFLDEWRSMQRHWF